MFKCSSASAEHVLALQELCLIAAGKLCVLAWEACGLTDMAWHWWGLSAQPDVPRHDEDRQTHLQQKIVHPCRRHAWTLARLYPAGGCRHLQMSNWGFADAA